jgi:hypothetical protein
LFETDSSVIPVAASTATITDTIVTTGFFFSLSAFVERIQTTRYVHAGTITVTDLADTALTIGIFLGLEVGTGPLASVSIASLASASAPGIATDTVNAFAAQTLFIIRARLAFFLLCNTVGTFAEII